MQFNQREDYEFVRPTEKSKGYWRRIPDRTPSPAQKKCRDQFRERALKTRGLTGVVELEDGRVISRTAFKMAGKDCKSLETQPAPQPEQINAPSGQIGTEPAKPQINPSITQGLEVRKRISLQDLIEAKALAQAVQEGKVSRQAALLWMMQKI